MKAHSKNFLATLFLGTSLLALTSCGGGGGGGGSGSGIQRQQDPIEADLEGQYKAVFTSMNSSVAGVITGSTTFSREENQLVVDLRFNGLHPNLLHTQYVHIGHECPTNDENGDGFIDAVESEKVTGLILVPLDADLNSQDRGSSIFPVSDAVGAYNYTQLASYDRFMSDLREPDMDPQDDFVKLGSDKNLALSGRVVMIYGVAPESVLPSTVATRGRLANFQTLPIACGVFHKVSTVPGSADNDQSLGASPGGSIIGGSSGADDGSVVIVGQTSGGTTGDTGGTTTTGSTSGGSTGWTDGGSDSGTSGGTTGATTGGSTTSGSTTGGGLLGGWHWPWEPNNGGSGGGTTTGGNVSH
jgi:hypothetical protein